MESGMAGTGTLVSGEEGGIGSGTLHRVGCGRVGGGLTGQRRRGDLDRVHCCIRRADLDDGHAGDDIRRANGDEELIRSGGDLFEDIFAADVRLRGHNECERREQKQDGAPDRQLHRCTPRIQRPKARPIQVEIEA
jgi:hypothetical protein